MPLSFLGSPVFGFRRSAVQGGVFLKVPVNALKR